MTNNIAAKVAEVKARLAAQKAATNQPVQQSVPTTYTTATPAEQPKKLTKEELLARAKAIIANNKAKTAELPSEPTKPLTDTPVVQVDKNQITKVLEAAKLTATGGQKDKSQISYEDLNKEQKLAVDYADQGIDFCLIGPAGTGKTTTCRCVATTLRDSGRIGKLTSNTKNLKFNSPSIVFVSYTNVAVSNIKEALPEEFKSQCLTIHKLLEYQPEFYLDVDDQGNTVKRVQYVPKYGINRESLPNISHCVIEESGSVPKWLYEELKAALPKDCTFIYLGDIEQLPPAFDDGILGYKLVEHSGAIVKLVEVYRQALQSPIISLAHKILKGHPIDDKQLKGMEADTDHGRLSVVQLKTGEDEAKMLRATGSWLAKLVKDGIFVQGRDVVLCPFNVRFGTIELAKYIAQARNLKDGNPVYEIIAGRDYFKHYYAVGDIVYYNRGRWVISEINENKAYVGFPTKKPSLNMDRWGCSINGEQLEGGEYNLASVMALGDEVDAAGGEKEEDIKQQASHIITLVPYGADADDADDLLIEVSAIGDINSMYLACCLTVHKAQGSEFANVYFIMHSCHSIMAYRELLYTAVTRARRGLTIVYEGENPKKRNDSIFQKGVIKQKIKGTSLEAKLQFFKTKIKADEIKKRLQKQKEVKQGIITGEDMEDDESQYF